MRCAIFVALAFLAAPWAAAAQQDAAGEHQALRERIEARFDVVPLGDGVGLRPKSRIADVRLIEVSDVIAINGVPASGQELRDKLGRDAEHVLRLSYLEPDARRALFAQRSSEPALERGPTPPGGPAAIPPPPEPPMPTGETRRESRSHGDRVRIFGDVSVREDEEVSGQAVAVFGSVRIDGAVGDQVVAVFGTVHLGPKAVVRGDVVSVGGRVHREPGAQVRGGVTEVSLAGGGMHMGRPTWGPFGPWFAVGPFGWHGAFGATSRLVGTTMRMALLMVLAAIVLVLGRGTVEGAAARLSDNPAKSTLVGVAAIVLTGPVLLLTSLVLVLTIIGIPILLILMPFVVLALLAFALIGFTASAYAVGQWTRRRFGATTPATFVDILVGIVVILLPLLVGRLLGFAGWVVAPVSVLLIAIGLGVEFLAWSSGFGAVLTNAFSGWQARRGARTTVPVPQQG